MMQDSQVCPSSRPVLFSFNHPTGFLKRRQPLTPPAASPFSPSQCDYLLVNLYLCKISISKAKSQTPCPFASLACSNTQLQQCAAVKTSTLLKCFSVTVAQFEQQSRVDFFPVLLHSIVNIF